MDVLGRRLAAEYPKKIPGKGITVYASRDVRIHPQIDVLLRGVASLLLGVVGLVLAIACSNLATLLLVRGAARAKEVSIRLALGATRGQLIRHLLTESLLLSLGGGVAGCLLAVVDHPLARRVRAADHRGLQPRLRVLGFAHRPLARHRRAVRPRAGAQGHAGGSAAGAARRRPDAIDAIVAGSRSRTRSSCSR